MSATITNCSPFATTDSRVVEELAVVRMRSLRGVGISGKTYHPIYVATTLRCAIESRRYVLVPVAGDDSEWKRSRPRQ